MADKSAKPGDVFDLEKIKQIVELMESCELAEVNLKQGDQQIQLKRGGQVLQMPAVAPAPAAAPPQPLAPSAAAPPPLPREGEPAEEKNIVYINSPMVGTFYIKPNPEADAFVRVGDRVDPETTVCIVEAMKVFNEIAAEISGEVVAVLVENEEAVEYGTPLFKVDIGK
jgi:acetyl-CoA carboxylase biotin carboxyl carrier protein